MRSQFSVLQPDTSIKQNKKKQTKKRMEYIHIGQIFPRLIFDLGSHKSETDRPDRQSGKLSVRLFSPHISVNSPPLFTPRHSKKKGRKIPLPFLFPSTFFTGVESEKRLNVSSPDYISWHYGFLITYSGSSTAEKRLCLTVLYVALTGNTTWPNPCLILNNKTVMFLLLFLLLLLLLSNICSVSTCASWFAQIHLFPQTGPP